MLAATGLVLATALAACGSSKSTETTTTTATSAQAFATSVCNAITTWKSALTKAANDVKSNPTKDTVDKAATDVQDATKTFTDTITGLEAPSTTASETAKKSLTTLQTELTSGIDSIQAATANVSGATEALTAVSKVTAELSTMATQLKSTADTLTNLPTGELKQAFESSPACASLKKG
jgi:hypothetical protein